MTKNPKVNQVSYTQRPDPDNDDQWLLDIEGTVVRIKTVHLEEDEISGFLRFNYDYDTVEGRPLNKEILDQVVMQVIQESAEYHQGRSEYLAEKE